LSIPAIVDQMGGAELPDPVVLAPVLSVVLEKLADPRKAAISPKLCRDTHNTTGADTHRHHATDARTSESSA